MFQDLILTSSFYVKMDAIDQLLLSEGVCRQLGIVSYHSSVTAQEAKRHKGSATVRSIRVRLRVRLVHSLKLLPSQIVLVPVRLNPHSVKDKSLFIEGGPLLEEAGLILEDAVVATPYDGVTSVTIVNMSGLTQKLPEEFVVGEAQAAEVVTPEDGPSGPVIRRFSSSQDKERRKKLLERIQLQGVPDADAGQLRTFLANNHSVFSLQDGERSDTSLVTTPIDTGDAPLRKRAPHQMMFTVREEVARQLRDMQRDGVIQSLNSPWSSPAVMVQKKGGSHRFCIHYRALNSVTKSDTFPLPRIEDLLEQLGGTRYFSTLDLPLVFGRSAWSHAPERRPHSSHSLGCINFS